MKLFVLGDTHGQIDKAIEIYKGLKDIDLIVHLGDHFADGQKLERVLGCPVLGVKGNMDGSFYADGYQILETSWGKIFIAHGHMENVKSNPQNILYKGESLGCKAVFYGHTHLPLYQEVEGMILLNPGSLTLPVGGRPGSYALVNIEGDDFAAAILYAQNEMTQEGSKGAKGASSSAQTVNGWGNLRNLLNNSDRF